MLRTLALISLFAIAPCMAWAADESVVYFSTSESEKDVIEEYVEIDRLTRSAYSSEVTIVDIVDHKNYVSAEPIAGPNPHTALTESGEQLQGTVWVAYVVTAKGQVAKPRVLKTTDKRIDRTALKALKQWRFTPGKLNDVAVATAVATPFHFTIENAPTEFVTQILEPTGGKISRPKEWFYREGHRSHVYMWTISRENTAGNKRYRTGIRIQAFAGIKEVTGKTAKQFVMDFAASKQKEATKVIQRCEEEDQGIFTRICLETKEGPYRILYSMFWASGSTDMAVISIAGTTEELWPTYAPTFEKMREFELIDMKRFDK